MDYITRTIQAYEFNVEKYENATRGIKATPEIERFVELLPNRDSMVVDAGCAFGRDVALLADHGAKVIGIDTSAALIQRAHELYPHLQFEQMDIRKLRFEDESIAGIWCHATLLHFKNRDIREILSEYCRVLIKGGILFATFKEGEGEEEVVESFTSDRVRFYKYQTMDSARQLFESEGLVLIDQYRVNEKERWQTRDLDWVYCFATKT